MANAEKDAQIIKHLYRSLDSTLSVLRKDEFASLQEVKDLMSTFDMCYPRGNKTDSNPKKTFIVLEGLDGSGKTTTSKELATAVNGVRGNTPPTVLQTLRPIFDTHPPVLRRAYYTLGNYVAAKQIEETLEYSSVILDRLKETYLRMREPAVTVINSNQPVKRVVSDILNFMKEKMII